jgi:hypothetical protein
MIKQRLFISESCGFATRVGESLLLGDLVNQAGYGIKRAALLEYSTKL